jgi:maltose-binding protein MalE
MFHWIFLNIKEESKMKKFLTVLLVLVMLMGLVTIASASEAGKLLIWCDETRAPVLEEAGKDFTTLYGIPVEVQEVGFGDIRGKLTTTAPVGEGADLIIGPHDWIGELIENGLLEPISLFTELRSKFVPVSFRIRSTFLQQGFSTRTSEDL